MIFFSSLKYHFINFFHFLHIKINNNSKTNHIFVLKDWLETNFTNQSEYDNGGIIFNVTAKWQ